jgi:hypothetical protein
MPTWSEFVAGFGWKEALIASFVLACIIFGREWKRILRRGR